MEKIKIIIADDHPVFLHGLKMIIEEDSELEVIAAASNGAEVLETVKSVQADIVILYVDMPLMNGLEAAQRVIDLFPVMEVIILTMYKDKNTLIKSLEIGVSGYVLKENAAMDIIQAIHSVHQGNNYLSPEMTKFLREHRRKRESSTEAADLLKMLTPTELRVLQLVTQYKSSKEIGEILFISEKTVSNHRMNIAKKLKVSGKNSLLRFGVQNKID